MIFSADYFKVARGLLLAGCLYHAASYAEDETVRPERILSVVIADWNADGGFDKAILLESATESDQADLLLYLSQSTDTLPLALSKKNLVWRGALWGTQPELQLAANQALAITSANDAIGRNRWHQKLTVIYRNKLFVVAGYNPLK
jgi:hypothetical protein